MDLHVWLGFVATSIVLLVIPGPTILLVVSYALGQGMRAAFPMAVGVALGDFTAMTVSMTWTFWPLRYSMWKFLPSFFFSES